MPYDPQALKVFIDGNAYNNPGGQGGYAGIADYPEHFNRDPEVIFQVGFHETTNNRMELKACIHAYKYVAEKGHSLNVRRALIVTDSQYVFKWRFTVDEWRRNGWRSRSGSPIENADLWKEFLSARSKACAQVRTELVWKKGKKSPMLKAIDKAAKSAGLMPTETDRGFRSGKIAPSRVSTPGASVPFPANSQIEVVRIYRTGLVGRVNEDKIFFTARDASMREIRYRAFTSPDIAAQLHRQHFYKIRFNADYRYPQIIELLEECEGWASEVTP